MAGDFGGLEEEMAEEFFVVGAGFGEAGDGFLGDDEDVGRGLGIDVAKGEDFGVFKDDVSGDFAGDDFFENVLAHIRFGGRPRLRIV